MQPDGEVKPDTVGTPVAGRRAAASPTTARCWCARPALFKEYYKNPQATAEAKDADGWFHTGDAGFFDADGHLQDHRPREGRRASSHDGTLFAPKYIENKLKFFPYIKEAVAFGDGRDDVVRVHQHRLRRGRQLGRAARHRLCRLHRPRGASPRCYDLVRECVEKVNADLAARAEASPASQIRRFLILHKELDADDGELTRTRKVRRGFIAEKYAALVDALYDGRDRAAHRDAGDVRGRPHGHGRAPTLRDRATRRPSAPAHGAPHEARAEPR